MAKQKQSPPPPAVSPTPAATVTRGAPDRSKSIFAAKNESVLSAISPQDRFLYDVAREWFNYEYATGGSSVADNPAMAAGMQRYRALRQSLTPKQIEEVNNFISGNNPAWLFFLEGATGNQFYFTPSNLIPNGAPQSTFFPASGAFARPGTSFVNSNQNANQTPIVVNQASSQANPVKNNYTPPPQSGTTFKSLLNAEMQSYIQEFVPQDNTVRKSALLKVFSGQPMTLEEAAWVSQNAASDYSVAHTMQYYRDVLDTNADQAKRYASQNQNDPILTPDVSALGSYALQYFQTPAPSAAVAVAPPAPAAAVAVAPPAPAAVAVAPPAPAAVAVAPPAPAAVVPTQPSWDYKNVTAADVQARAQQAMMDAEIVSLFASSDPEELALFTAAAKFLSTGETPAEPIEAQGMFNYIQSDSPLWMSYVEKNYGDPYRFMDPSVQANAVNQNSGPVGGGSSSGVSGSNSNPYLAAGSQKKPKEQFSPGGENYQGQFVNNNAFENSGAATSSRTYMDRLDDQENQNNADIFERQKNIRSVAGAKATNRMPGSTTSSGSTQEMYNIQPNVGEIPYYFPYEEKYVSPETMYNLPVTSEPASYPYVSQNEMYADAIAKLAKLSEYPSNNAAAMYPMDPASAPISWQATYGMVNPMPQDEMYRQVSRPFTPWQNTVNPVSQNEMYANISPYRSEGPPNAPYEYDQFMFNRRDSITNTPQYSSLSSVNNVPQNQMYGFSPAGQANFLTQYPTDYREGANAPEAPRVPYASQNEMYDPFIGSKRITLTNNAQYATIPAVNSVSQNAMYGITQRPQGSYLDQYPTDYREGANAPEWISPKPKEPAHFVPVWHQSGAGVTPLWRHDWPTVVENAYKPESKYRRQTKWGGY